MPVEAGGARDQVNQYVLPVIVAIPGRIADTAGQCPGPASSSCHGNGKGCRVIKGPDVVGVGAASWCPSVALLRLPRGEHEPSGDSEAEWGIKGNKYPSPIFPHDSSKQEQMLIAGFALHGE